VALAGGTGYYGRQQINQDSDVSILVGIHGTKSDAFCDYMEDRPQRGAPGIRVSIGGISSN
jgi:hypothetical protein